MLTTRTTRSPSNRASVSVDGRPRPSLVPPEACGPSARTASRNLAAPATTSEAGHQHEGHLHLHRRGARARHRTRCCRSSRRSPAPPASRSRLRDISLAGRILAAVPRAPDRRASASPTPSPSSASWRTTPEANIIKLPNISASIPQLKAAIAELQAEGYALPDYPDEPATDAEQRRPRPLRHGQGQRRQPGAARGQLRPPRARRRSRTTPASTRTRWARGRRTRRPHVATMGDDDFFAQRAVGHARRPTTSCGSSTSRADGTRHRAARTSLAGARRRDRRRAPFMRTRGARRLPRRADRRRQGGGRAVLGPPQGHDDEGLRPDHLRPRRARVLRRRVRRARRRARARRRRPQRRPRRRCSTAIDDAARRRAAPRSRPSIDAAYADRPAPRDGRLRQGHHQPARAERRDRRRLDARRDPHVGPDVERRRRAAGHARPSSPTRSYAARLRRRRSTTAASTARSTRRRWASTPNVGLMAQKAEEYGSPRQDLRDRRRRHACASSTRAGDDAARARGRGGRHLARVPDQGRRRSATGSSSPSTRARATGAPAVFWLDETRAHDAELIAQGARRTSPSYDTDGPRRSRSWTLADGDALHARARRARRGHDLGHRQRAARLPHRPVPDPRARHEREDALDRAADERRRPVRDRRRRLGPEARAAVRRRRTTCAGTRSASSSRSAVSLELLADKTGNPRRAVLGRRRSTRATGTLLENDTLARRASVGEIDNRGSHFYLALYWAQALAAQTDDAELAARVRAARRGARGRRGDDRRASSTRCRASRSTSAATTSPTAAKVDGGDAPERHAQRGARRAVGRRRGGAGLGPCARCGPPAARVACRRPGVRAAAGGPGDRVAAGGPGGRAAGRDSAGPTCPISPSGQRVRSPRSRRAPAFPRTA